MDKDKKDEIKKKAENIAAFLGYNVNSINIDVINIQEAYCQGYSQALKDTKQDTATFPMDKWIEFKRDLFAFLELDSLQYKTLLDRISELESFGKPAGEAKEQS
jgi:hypothetical protein